MTATSAADASAYPELVARLYYLSGLANSRLNRTEAACRSYSSEIELSESLDGSKRLAHCLCDLGDWQSAAEVARSALARTIEPSAEAFRIELRTIEARALHHLERYDEAVNAYRLAGLDEEDEALSSALAKRKQQEAEDARCADLIEQAKIRKADSGWQPGTPEWNMLMVEIKRSLETCPSSQVATTQ